MHERALHMTPLCLDRAAIEARIPHAGAMSLLDAVVQWDAAHIACTAAAPTALHPLARAGRVPAIACAEYAAQACAVHGSLLDDQPAPAALLAKLSDIDLPLDHIPTDAGPLAIRAHLLGRNEAACRYTFEVECVDQPIARGQLMVAFTAA